MEGKCWIYKRATLLQPGVEPRIIDYSDGTEPFDCSEIVYNEYPKYLWKLPGHVVTIPMNVPRNHVSSMVEKGSIPFGEGKIEYEFLYGKFKTYNQFYMCQFRKCLPFVLLVLFIVLVVQRYLNRQ